MSGAILAQYVSGSPLQLAEHPMNWRQGLRGILATGRARLALLSDILSPAEWCRSASGSASYRGGRKAGRIRLCVRLFARIEPSRDPGEEQADPENDQRRPDQDGRHQLGRLKDVPAEEAASRGHV